MGALGLEAIFIGDVVDSVGHAVVSDVVERSADAEDSLLRSSNLNLSRFIPGGSIAQLIVEFVSISTNGVINSLFQDYDILAVPLGSSDSNSHEGNENCDL